MDKAVIARLQERYPSIDDLARAAQRRIPHFAWEYLDSGTGLEAAISRNRAALDGVTFKQQFMKGRVEPDLGVELFGKAYAAPLGMSPVGMTGMLWPGAETMLAATARKRNIPYCLSSVACETPETIGAIAGANAWFQLYTIVDKDAEADLVRRAGDSGFSVLVVTIDVPVNSTRERQRKAGLARQGLSLSRLGHIAARPQWAAATARRGMPALRMLEKYFDASGVDDIMEYVDQQRLGDVDLAHLATLRKLWKGPLVVKGIMHEADAKACLKIGADGIWVSNHGARQFDAAPSPVEVLGDIADTVGGKAKILFDSGIRTGLDVIRALSLGADFAFAGRAFVYGPCVAGQAGAHLAAEILIGDLENNMIQLCAQNVADLRGLAA